MILGSRKCLVVIGACALLLAGCGGGSGVGGAGGSSLPASSDTTDHGALKAVPGPDGSMIFGVAAGASRRAQALEALDFFPGSITVDVGDSVTWTNGGNAHTITFGTPPANFNPNAPAGGSTYDGSTFTSSGFTVIGQTYTLTFTKAGTYPYYCLFHGPEMVGVVVVQPKGTPVPRPLRLLRRSGPFGREQRAFGSAERAGALPVCNWGPDAHRRDSTRTRRRSAIDEHGPPVPGRAPSWERRFQQRRHRPGWDDRHVGRRVEQRAPYRDLPPVGQPAPNIDPFSPPSGPSTYDGSTLVNSGPFGLVPFFPSNSFSLTFTKAGTYKYYCLFHHDFGMVGTVVVK